MAEATYPLEIHLERFLSYRPYRAGNRIPLRSHSLFPEIPSPSRPLKSLDQPRLGVELLAAPLQSTSRDSRSRRSVTWGNAFAISSVEAPLPQPTSATRAPASSFCSTSASGGIHQLTRLAAYPGKQGRQNGGPEGSNLLPSLTLPGRRRGWAIHRREVRSSCH